MRLTTPKNISAYESFIHFFISFLYLKIFSFSSFVAYILWYILPLRFGIYRTIVEYSSYEAVGIIRIGWVIIYGVSNIFPWIQWSLIKDSKMGVGDDCFDLSLCSAAKLHVHTLLHSCNFGGIQILPRILKRQLEKEAKMVGPKIISPDQWNVVPDQELETLFHI